MIGIRDLMPTVFPSSSAIGLKPWAIPGGGQRALKAGDSSAFLTIFHQLAVDR